MFNKNTFFTKKTTPISKILNSFGYIKTITKNRVIVDWYDNYTKVELQFKLKELIEGYKSIYPYYNTPYLRGNIWKYSYGALLTKIHRDTGFSKIKVDKVTYKKTPVKRNDVEINDAKYVLYHNITDLKGKITKVNKCMYEITTSEGVYCMPRTYFTLLPQDEFILLSVRC